jgi:hypothetical protein
MSRCTARPTIVDPPPTLEKRIICTSHSLLPWGVSCGRSHLLLWLFLCQLFKPMATRRKCNLETRQFSYLDSRESWIIIIDEQLRTSMLFELAALFSRIAVEHDRTRLQLHPQFEWVDTIFRQWPVTGPHKMSEKQPKTNRWREETSGSLAKCNDAMLGLGIF